MGKLSSAIVQRKLATLRDVEEALARQVLYGGDLATNLLEQAPSVDERALTELLAEIHGLAPTTPGRLPPSAPEARSLVPGDVALRHGLYPLERNGGELTIAVAEPLKPEVEQDLGFGLGVTLVQRVAPLVRVREAISRDYGVPLDRRSLRVLAKLEGKPDPSPSIAPSPLSSAPALESIPRPPTIPPLGLPAPMDMSPLYPAVSPAAPPAAAEPPPVAAIADAGPRVAAAPSVAILPIAAVGPVVVNAPPATIAEAESSSSSIDIHDRLTSPAPPVAPISEERTIPWPVLSAMPVDGALATRVTAPAPVPAPTPVPPAAAATPERRPGSGQYAIPLTDLAAWGAENKEAERKRGRARRRGPYTAASAEQDLLNAEGRDDVLRAFFDFSCQYFEYSALFAVHGDLAEGRDACGPGADRSAVTGIGVPLDLPSSLRAVRDEGRFTITTLEDSGLDARLAKDLARTRRKRVLLLPLVMRNRCVLIFYGDDGDDDVELSEVGDIIAFSPLVASALENVILKKKTAVRKAVDEEETGVKRPPSARPQQRSRVPLPTRGERVEALTEALQSTVRPVIPSEPPRRALTPPPMQAPRTVTPAQGTPSRASTPPPPPAGTPVFELSRKSSQPKEAQASPPAESPHAAKLPEPRLAPPRPEPTRPAAAARDDAPEISVGTEEADWDEPGATSQVVVAAQLPIKRYQSEELRLPTVIVNVDADVELLVKRALEGDETAVDRLRTLGASAASLLVSKFPGPTKTDSDCLGAPEPASQRGPILRALAGIGAPAVPFVVARSSDADPQVRALATLLLGELPSEDSAQAVARRVTDSSAEVRRAALEAGRLLQSDAESRTTLRDRISSLAEDASADVEARVAAIEALSHIRDTRTVPRLIRLVAQNDEVGQSAQWALSVITRQAFGRDSGAWEGWWKEHQSQHRIVWLIDALMHDDPEIRRAAGEELKALTKEYFGYYDDLSKGERQKAQRRYKDWWEATGKARFVV